MADLKMNEFATATSVSKVVGVDSNGNNRLISANDFIHSANNNGAIADLNTALKTGVYRVSYGTDNAPINDYGLVDVIANSIYIVQIFYGLNQPSVFYRRSIDSGSSFNGWTKIK